MTRTIDDYAAAVASGEPAPGGGSVIATVAALATGLADMVCHLTLARAVDPPVAMALTEAQSTAARLRSQFLISAGEDELAYGAYRIAANLPKTTPEERETRRDALEAALKKSAGVPLGVAGGCVELLAALETVATLGTKHALADVSTSLRLTDASLQSALDMVSANTVLMRDRETAARLEREANELRVRGAESRDAVIQALDSRPKSA